MKALIIKTYGCLGKPEETYLVYDNTKPLKKLCATNCLLYIQSEDEFYEFNEGYCVDGYKLYQGPGIYNFSKEKQPNLVDKSDGSVISIVENYTEVESKNSPIINLQVFLEQSFTNRTFSN